MEQKGANYNKKYKRKVSLIIKVYSYFKSYGFFGIIKKVLIKIANKISYSNNKSLTVKEGKKIFIFSKQSYYYNKSQNLFSQYARTFNEMGFIVNFVYEEDDIKESKMDLPLNIHKNINSIWAKKIIKMFNKETIIILDENISNIEKFNKFTLNSDIQIIKEKNEKLQSNENKEYWFNKCNNKINNIQDVPKKFKNNLSIIILNYNNKNIIKKCIDSLLSYNYRYNYEIIVVDNRSNDGSYEMLAEEYKNKIKIIRNKKNGCASGRNLGVSIAKGEYIMFLDSDQWAISENWLDNYLNIMNENVGAIGWAAGWFNKNGYAEHITDSFPFRYMPPKFMSREDIGYLGTGGFIISKKLFNKLQGFDLAYDPTCYEDTDLSLKIRDVGERIIYCPYLGVEHLPHQTTNIKSKEHEKLAEEKGKYFVNKWRLKNSKLLKYIKTF